VYISITGNTANHNRLLACMTLDVQSIPACKRKQEVVGAMVSPTVLQTSNNGTKGKE
jgi:hypothetical protein